MLKYILPIALFVQVFASAHTGMEGGEIMKENIKKDFQGSDADRSGGLNQTEFVIFHEKMRANMEKNRPSDEEMFKKLDTNNDGQVTEEEFHSGMHHKHHKHCGSNCKGKR